MSAVFWLFGGNYANVVGSVLVLGMGLLSLGIGYYYRKKSLQVTGLCLSILAVLTQTAEYLLMIPWWGWLAIIGVGILAMATEVLRRRGR